MRVAFPTNNLKTLSPHTALSKYIAIVEINDKVVTERIAVRNPIPKMAKEVNSQESNRGLGSGKIIAQILFDYNVDTFVAKEIGESMELNLKQAGIKVVKSEKTNINEIINDFLEVSL